MLNWPFLILDSTIEITIHNIAFYLLHPLFLMLSLGLGFCIVDRKIWGRTTLFVITLFLCGLYIDTQWPIVELPPEHMFAQFPKPILSLTVMFAYMGWIAWEYRQGVIQFIALSAVLMYAYTLHQMAPLEWKPCLVTIIYVISAGGIYELVSRMAKNYPPIIGLIMSVGTIPLIMHMQAPTPLMHCLQGLLIAHSLGWILSGSEGSTGKGFQLTTLFTALVFLTGGILLWIVIGIAQKHISTIVTAHLMGALIGLWITVGVHKIIQFYSKK